MIIKTLEELEPYRHLTVRDYVEPGRGKLRRKAYEELCLTEILVQMCYGENLLYYVVKGYQIENKSLNRLSAELGLHPKFLARKMHEIGVPMLTKQEVLKRSVELGLGIHGLSHDKRVEIGKVAGRRSYTSGNGIHGLSPEDRRKYGSFAGRKSYSSGKGLGSLSHDELVELGRRSYELRVGIHTPCKRNDYLPTIHGRRIDVPYDAKSAYEANIYRVLTYLGFQIEHDVPIELKVDELRKEIFKSDNTTFVVDFKAVSQKGAEYWYEICAHPYEDPIGLEKILMFNQQYSDRKMIVVVGDKFDSSTFPVAAKSYKALEKAFAAAIDRSERFAGWERKGYNLKTHPEVFGSVVK